MKKKEMKRLEWLIKKWALFDRCPISPYKRAVTKDFRIKPDYIRNDIDNSFLSEREKDSLLKGIEDYYYHGKPISLSNRMILWKVRTCHYIKSCTIAKLALPPKHIRSKTSNKRKNYGKRNQL